MTDSDTLRKVSGWLAAVTERPQELAAVAAEFGRTPEQIHASLLQVRSQLESMIGSPRDGEARNALAALDEYLKQSDKPPNGSETQSNAFAATGANLTPQAASPATEKLRQPSALPDTVNATKSAAESDLSDFEIPHHEPPPLTAEQLEVRLMQLGLLPPKDLSAARNEFSTTGNDDSRSFASHLVQSGKLTKFQANEVLAGRGHSLALGDYRLEEKLGQGGMGAVYRARHVRLGKRVAIKVLPRELLNRPDAVSRFEREMQAVGALNHPNIIQAHDAGEKNGIHFLSMELVDGKDVDAVFRGSGFQPDNTAANDRLEAHPTCCEIIRQAALGLQHAHEKGLVHRDIKPSNLLLTRDGTVKILDLGLALLESGNEGDLTSTGQVMGTLDYIAPEQVASTHHVDIRADLYSLGCTLYRLLVGHPPFPHPEYNTAARKMYAHSSVQPKPASEFRDDLPTELLKILDRLLAKKPEARYRTPRELAEAIEPFCEGANLPALFNPVPRRTGRTEGEGIKDVKSPDASPQSPGQQSNQASLPSPQSSRKRVRVRGSSGSFSTTTSLRKPRPLFWIATGFFSVLILTGIIITILDKDGKVVGKMEVPEGGSFNVEQSPVPSPQSSGDSAEQTPVPSPQSSGERVRVRGSPPSTTNLEFNIPEVSEPPPLDEWLKGREILTVKQDGTAMFTKIQDALDALKPGQVVEVLDKGPYVDNLSVNSPPENTGLFSRVGSKMVSDKGTRHLTKGKNGEQVELESCWDFLQLNQFRIEGITFVDKREVEKSVIGHTLTFEGQKPNCYLLNCFIGSIQSYSQRYVVSERPKYCVNISKSGVIRNSVIIGKLRMEPEASTCEVANCLVSSQDSAIAIFDYNQKKTSVQLRRNIVYSRGRSVQFGGERQARDQLTLFGNTFHIHRSQSKQGPQTLFVFQPSLRARVLDVRRNCIVGFRGLQDGVYRDVIDGSNKNVTFRDNTIGLLEPAEAEGLPIFPTERLVKPEFLSLDPLDRNFIRIKADPRFLIPETGEYIGALPPGPAPAEGDWFTEMLDKWRPELKEFAEAQMKKTGQAL
jgi:serine/threonine protein kinase